MSFIFVQLQQHLEHVLFDKIMILLAVFVFCRVCFKICCLKKIDIVFQLTLSIMWMTNVNIQESGLETSHESQFVTTCGKYDIHSTILFGFEPHLTSVDALIDTNITDIIVQYLPKGNNLLRHLFYMMIMLILGLSDQLQNSKVYIIVIH